MALKIEKGPAQGDKKKRQRSPNYPAVGLNEAIERLNNFMSVDGRAGAPPEMAARHLGFTSAHGGAMSVLAALKRFGLVEDKDGRIVPTQRGIEINSLPATHERRIKAIREAALAPPIYADLIEQYRATGLPHDETLEGELKADRGFNPNGVRDFIKGFRDTLEFAGLSNLKVLNSDSGEQKPKFKVGDLVQWEANGVLKLPEPKRIAGFYDDAHAHLEGSSNGVPVAELIPVEAPPEDSFNPLPPIVKLPEMKVAAGKLGASVMRQDVFSLAEGVVTIQWPSVLSADSIKDIKDWLQIVERKIARSVSEEEPEYMARARETGNRWQAEASDKGTGQDS